MGAGKSTVGRRLAKKLGLQFFDSDQEIENRTGASITLIFEIERENGFRKRESEIIEELTKYPDIVLATGGGAVLDSQNRKYLVERGLVVYLKADIKQLIKRIAKDNKRPLLNSDNRTKKMEQLLADRATIYENLAELVVDTDQLSITKIVDTISRFRAKRCESLK
jgi:shikimate kinase